VSVKAGEVRVQRGIRLALESGRPVAHIAADLGINSETLRKRVRQAEADAGARPDLPTTALQFIVGSRAGR
jgi:transposase-like protein